MDTVYSLGELISRCEGRDLLAFGTGNVGRLLIPYLAEKTRLKLCGVTNSGVTEEDAGLFENTNLPVRSIEAWYKRLPAACILVTTIRSEFQREIASFCREIGFRDIVCVYETLESEVLFSDLQMSVEPRKLAVFNLLLPYIDAHLMDCMCHANAIRDTHRETFHEFRNCHRDQTVVIVASGPTVNDYEQVRGLRHIGVNGVFLNSKITLDYYFTEDYHGKPVWYDELKKYDFVKFIGLAGYSGESRELYRVSEDILDENEGARTYFIQTGSRDINCDIEHYPVMGLGSVVFSALHFALYTRLKRILLVGCDCSSGGHFDGSTGDSSFLLKSWGKAKCFISRFYPNIEIISVNPVGLREMFRDVYTESYLESHPELDRTKCEIMDPDALR